MAQEVFVGILQHGPLQTEVVSDRSFQSYFEILIEKEVSLFNITYLEQLCDCLPDDIR